MQPYLFPYLGYLQLGTAADHLVLLDDVQYIKRGWVNRNYILLKGQKHRFTLNVRGASQNATFRNVWLGDNRTFLPTLRHAYGKAPHFDPVCGIIGRTLASEVCIADTVADMLARIYDYAGLSPSLSLSSALKLEGVRGEARILAICKRLKATRYINPPGGIALYSSPTFAGHGIRLEVLRPRFTQYDQGSAAAFIPGLSCIDALMWNGPATQSLLRDYHIDVG